MGSRALCAAQASSENGTDKWERVQSRASKIMKSWWGMNDRGEIRELHICVFHQGKSFGISDRYKLREEGSAQAGMDNWDQLEAAE